MARRGRKPKRRINWEANKGILRSALSLILIALAVISVLAIFAGLGEESGVANSKLRGVLVGSFGLLVVFIPVLLLYAGLLSIGTLRFKFLTKRIFIGLTLLFFALLGMLGGLGGAVGELIQQQTARFVSTPGAIFLYLCLVIFSIVIITNTGLHVFIEKFGVISEKVKAKFLKIPGKSKGDEVKEDGEIELDEDGMPKIDPPEGAVDAEVVEDDKETPSYLTTDNEPEQAAFKLVHPPSGPVTDDVAPAELVKGDDADETPKIEKEKKTELSRLPFSNKVWEYPPLSLLSDIPNQPPNAGNIQERAKIIEDTLKAFGVKATISDVHVGPAVTQYALGLAAGTKTSKVQNLATDLALRLKSPSGSVRIEAPIPGTNLVGIEVPNFTPSTVPLRGILESDEMKKSKRKLQIGLGHDVSGKTLIQDISKWPHCLVAGATGSGKSVMLNAMISQLLFRCSPSECRFIMIDPKLVELSLYNGIPHLLTPVVTDIEQKAVSAFAWAVAEMERRYQLFANAGVRNLEGYNQLSGFQAEPYIIIVVDEIADMMMVAASEIEKYIIRLAQKSRATGIHLILATQRPSVNILTGTIKANVPTRMAFKVTSQVDSRVILDQVGAETLIGRGDMLFTPPDDAKPKRVQGAFISDKEIKALVEHLKNIGVEPDYKEEITEQEVAKKSASGSTLSGDEKMTEALELVIQDGKASASYLQRKLGIGYSRAARMIDDMEDAGIIGPPRGSKARDVLIAGVDDAILRLSGGGEEEIVS